MADSASIGFGVHPQHELLRLSQPRIFGFIPNQSSYPIVFSNSDSCCWSTLSPTRKYEPHHTDYFPSCWWHILAHQCLQPSWLMHPRCWECQGPGLAWTSWPCWRCWGIAKRDGCSLCSFARWPVGSTRWCWMGWPWEHFRNNSDKFSTPGVCGRICNDYDHRTCLKASSLVCSGMNGLVWTLFKVIIFGNLNIMKSTALSRKTRFSCKKPRCFESPSNSRVVQDSGL